MSVIEQWSLAEEEYYEIFADASVRDGVSIIAWYINREQFGVARIEEVGSHFAEARAIMAALSNSQGCVRIISDCQSLVSALNRPRTSWMWSQAVKLNPAVEQLRDGLERRQSVVRFRHGHGEKSPDGLKFCDILSRAVSRRIEQLELEVGEVITSIGGESGETRCRRAVMPPCPMQKPLVYHMNSKVLSALGYTWDGGDRKSRRELVGAGVE